MARTVTFEDSCAYELPQYNQDDVNKLFGLSFGLFGLHKNSARFGWRWNAKDQRIDLLAYCYVGGKPNWDEQLRFPVVAQVKPGQQVWCSIEVTHDPEFGQEVYEFNVDAPGQPWRSKTVNRHPVKGYGFTHGLYFGGSQPAPHDMHIQVAKS